MARLRWTLALIALGIGLPALLIVQRATESLTLENAYRHQAVAERVFDEMERSLSDFLLREEARPPGHYVLFEERGDSDRPDLDAAFGTVDEPFVLGWFSLDGTGTPRTFTRNENGGRGVAALDAAVQEAFAPRDATDPTGVDAESPSSPRTGPAPGRTRALGRATNEQEALADGGMLESTDLAESTPYEVLQKLNRAGSIRSERQSKALQKGSAKKERAEDALAARAPANTASRREAGPEADDLARRDAAPTASALRPTPGSRPSIAMTEERFATVRDLAADADEGSTLEEPLAETLADARAQESAAARERGEAAFEDEADALVIDPFVGRSTNAGRILLTRSVWQRGTASRQGIVLDRDRLVSWLRGGILRDAGLADVATLEFGPAAASAPTEGRSFRYQHRFAEPFDALVGRLDLEPLPGFQTARSLYLLAALLGLALVIGLLAVDRMTRVVVEYAERRSNFVAAVSHELRTPLTSIRMYGEMLRDGLVASESKRAEYHAAITDESERLSRLIDNVLDFSRLEQDRRPLELVAGGLDQTVREACEKLRAHTERAGFTLEVDVERPAGRVRYDRDAVTQIVFNLIDNARKYARDGASSNIEVRLEDIEGETVLSVRDHGPGVPDAELRRIFEPFYRIGDELTREADGTGIGLALVADLAEAMGGRAEATRPTEGGLEVRVTFAKDDPTLTC